jgi:serine/threonine protein kinase/tetratricopeptide (TPR) repeat protein
VDPHDEDPRPSAADIFADALEQSDDVRASFVERACGNDDELREEVLTLLRASPEAGKWFAGAAHEGLQELAEATLLQPASSDATGRIVSHYRLEEFLGAGGMGEVYRATDVALGRRAAVKLLRPGVGDEIRERLLREANAAAHLTHPAIAQFYDAGVADGVDFLAMEFVEGTSLRARLQQGPLPVGEALAIASALLEAMVHAHAAGFLHRDIKPENIVVTGKGAAKLLDFGLAKEIGGLELPGVQDATVLAQAALTSHGTIVGTPGYMSPEQLQGLPVDERTDVFALGAVLHEMLSGKRAFKGLMIAQDLEAIANELPSLQPLHRDKLPADIDLILRRAVASDPAARYPSAAVFLSELHAVSSGESVAVLPNTLAITDLRNLRADPEDDWIGNGVAESLAVDLRRAQGLDLVPRARVMQTYRSLRSKEESPSAVALGLAVGCRWVLTGGFQRAGQALRLTVQLIEVATGRELWVEKLDGSVDDIFDMQDRLAALTAESLEIIVPKETAGAPNLDAFECFTRAKKLLHTRTLGQAERGRELLEEALERDPNYAPILATMAHYYAPVRWWSTGDPRDLATALEHAERAVVADPQLAEGHLWKGYAQWRRGDIDGALESFQRVKELDPNEFQGWYFTACAVEQRGCWEEALEEQRYALKLEPTIPYILLNIGMLLIEIGDLDAAIWTMEEEIRMEGLPGAVDFTGGAIQLAEALRRAGRLEEARKRCIAGLEQVEQSDSMGRASLRLSYLSQLGRIALDQGDLEGAEIAFEQAISGIRTHHRGIGLGWGLVAALAGLARAGQGPEPYEEALRICEERVDYDFAFALHWECNVLLELAHAARALGREGEAQELYARARAAGTRQPFN